MKFKAHRINRLKYSIVKDYKGKNNLSAHLFYSSSKNSKCFSSHSFTK